MLLIMKRSLQHLILCLLCLGQAQLYAHGNPSESWRTLADQPPHESLIVQVHNSPLGKQLIVANEGSRVLEITGPEGRPFLRIGPQGVDADFAAQAWYHTQNPGKRPLPETARDSAAPADWRTVSKNPSWGWFDPRLTATDKDSAGKPIWAVPAKLGGEPVKLTGYSESMSAARELHHPRVKSEILPEKVILKIIPDVAPAILIAYNGSNALVVYGQNGHPFLRFNRNGVYANTNSAEWRALGRAAATPDNSHWAHLSPTPRYTWPDPRLVFGSNTGEQQWSIPVAEAGRDYTITGDWKTIAVGH